MGVNLPNHAYVNLTEVGNDISDPGNILRCHTDLGTCCTSAQGDHRGDWYFPDGRHVLGSANDDSIRKRRGPKRIDLRRINNNNVTSPSGIYRCDIETIAVNDDDFITIMGETVYVGLYFPSEGMEIINVLFLPITYVQPLSDSR